MRVVALLALTATAAQAQTTPMTGALGQQMLASCLEEAAPGECMGEVAQLCMESDPPNTQTTLGMMECFQIEHAVWDAELNAQYSSAMTMMERDDLAEAEYGEAGQRVERLRAAQRAWIGFRDAQCALDQAIWGTGSMRLIEGAACLAEITAERTVYLIELQERPQ